MAGSIGPGQVGAIHTLSAPSHNCCSQVSGPASSEPISYPADGSGPNQVQTAQTYLGRGQDTLFLPLLCGSTLVILAGRGVS